ncbi:MAG: 30S ribosomal protein S3ae [Candidatus Thermoplasmatota archaeon]|nr:30S ribosomal protein S3ae [Candidatus Thermoplasmatota archaeon]MDP7264691.1 30S ribosomal protein S3ae [Candidatus Thermoplasmatota archaeon]
MGKKKKVSRSQMRKAKDRWKSKEWFNIYAPVMFNKSEIGNTMSNDASSVVGRTLDATLHEIMGDFSKIHIKLKFKINDVVGNDAYTRFIGHCLTSDYIRRLTRRKRSKMDAVFDVLTKDGYLVRVKPLAMTEHRIQSSQKRAIRERMKEVVEGFARENIMSEFVKGMVFGKLPVEIFRVCKKIYPMKRIEIRKSEILRAPASTPDEGMEEEKPEEEEVEEGAEEVTGEVAEADAVVMAAVEPEEEIAADV